MIVDFADVAGKYGSVGQIELGGYSVAQEILRNISHRLILAAHGHVVSQRALHAGRKSQAGEIQAAVGFVQRMDGRLHGRERHGAAERAIRGPRHAGNLSRALAPIRAWIGGKAAHRRAQRKPLVESAVEPDSAMSKASTWPAVRLLTPALGGISTWSSSHSSLTAWIAVR